MRYESYFDAFSASIPKDILRNPAPLRRRLTCEGIVSFAAGMKEAYDAILTGLASDGYADLSHLPYIPRGVFEDVVGSDLCDDLLNYVGMFNKLCVSSRTAPSKIQSFIDRNRATSAFAGAKWEDILPIDDHCRHWIRDHMGPVPMSLVCRHGPGATAEKLVSWDKWLAVLYPQYRENAIRIIEVPKDFSGQRVIGIEPVIKQFVQQGIARHLRLETKFGRRFLSHLTRPDLHVARALPTKMTTIDLKDASDTVSLSLVDHLFGADWGTFLRQWSTGVATLPDGSGHSLAMIATMGCGFCFEVETIVFHLVAALIAYNQLRCVGCSDAIGADVFLSRSTVSLDHLVRQVSVFGDDIVLPRSWMPWIDIGFAASGLILNPKKTCRTERFAETCGYWIKQGSGRTRVATPRFTPSLEGMKTCLTFESQSSRFDLAARAYESGYAKLAELLAEAQTAIPARWNKKLQRIEIRMSSLGSIVRQGRVSDDIRYLAYWKTGNADDSSEVVRKTRRYEWRPLASYSYLCSLDKPLQFYHGTVVAPYFRLSPNFKISKFSGNWLHQSFLLQRMELETTNRRPFA